MPHVHGQGEVEAQLALASPAGPVARLPELRAPVQGGGWRKMSGDVREQGGLCIPSDSDRSDFKVTSRLD